MTSSEETIKLEDLSSIAVNVAGVKVEGVGRTRLDILETVTKRCLDARTFGELTKSLAKASETLERLELFKELKFVIDAAPEEDGLIVKMQAKEKKYKVRVGTEIQKNEVGFGAGGVFYNVLGRAEKLDINASLGSQSATPLSINFTKPINGDPDRTIKLAALSTLQHYINGANFKNRLQGISASYSFVTNPQLLHELKYSLDWRHVSAIGENASLTVRRNAGHSLKSSLSYMTTFSTLNSPIFPSNGLFTRCGSELAGLGGSVKFLRNDFMTKFHFPLFREISLYTSARIGHVLALGDQKLGIIDKYQLGGPLSVRGFALNSLGPKDKNDATGGDLSMEAGLGVSFPFSANSQEIMRGHLFANAGILTNVDYHHSIARNAKTISAMRPNVSIGAGLQVKLGDAKIEFNIAHPLSMQKDATFHRGIQVGIGVEFL